MTTVRGHYAHGDVKIFLEILLKIAIELVVKLVAEIVVRWWSARKTDRDARQFFLTWKATADAPEYLREAAKVIDYRNMTVKEREVLTAEERAQATAENIYYGAIEQGKTEGIAIGEARGIAEGEASKARSAARNMLQKGYRLDVIADLLEIPIAEVTAITAEM